MPGGHLILCDKRHPWTPATPEESQAYLKKEYVRKRCLMPDTQPNNKPGPAESTNESQVALEYHLQRQLEDDIARIFDESIYSDLEVVCGKLKILTHSCILKARTDQFYHQLHTFLHVNIERNTFDEIYSFISDVYTECNIQHEEKEIIKFLQRNLNALKPVSVKSSKTKEESEEPEVFSTPKCITPYVDSDTHKVIQSSPSTELTKEYYALVPIEGNLFEKELIEQDELSNAFHSIIKGQTEDKNKTKLQLNKPTSLPLNSSHTSKTVKHSSSYNIINNIGLKEKTSPKPEHSLSTAADKDFKTNQVLPPSDTAGRNTNTKNKSNSLDAAYSPDSLITDEPSSSSDYLSAAYTFSPGVNTSGIQHQINVEEINLNETLSPVDWSESNDNDDSLEQGEKKDPDSIIKDLSPTIFEMTPITEDSLCTNAFENAAQSDVGADVEDNTKYLSDKEKLHSAVYMPCYSTSTPNNSILSVKIFKPYESEDSESNTIIDSDSSSMNVRKGSRSPPILSGGVSVEDHLPQVGSSHEANPSLKSKQNEICTVTGKQSSSSAWVVDMSSNPEADDTLKEHRSQSFFFHRALYVCILSGGWVESLGNVIVLPPFSYNVVYFALCHIYSGLATIPDSVSIVELATIADMLGLEGLKEAIMFTLKAKYCHHFHKPCAVCIVGVLECFPLSAVYGLDDLYHKCVKWITKHFTKVWPTKAFATLPTDLLDKCFQHHTVNLTVDNVVDTVYGCGITTASLQNSKWAESVARMCRRLISVAAHFAGPRLLAVYQAIPPLPNEAPQAAKQALDDFLAAAIEWAPPDEVCRAYGFLSALLKEMRNSQYSKPDLISNGTENRKSFGQNTLVYSQAGNWRMQCEGALVRASPRVVTTQAFKELPSELRKRLRELGCIKYGAHALPISSPTHQPERKIKTTTVVKNKSFTSSPRNIDIAHVRALFVPYSPKPMYPVGSVDTLKSNNDIRDSKKSIVSTNPPKVRTTKAQEERAKYNKIKNTKSQDKLNTKASSARAPSFERTKPRYLDIKQKEKKTSVVNKHLPKIESSSESSRNSSPIHLRNLRSSPQKGRRGEMVPQTMSQDSLATSSRPRTAEPSTDSLSESQTSNRYATYTKTKHTKGAPKPDSSKVLKSVEPTTASGTSNKIKTKIPVYLNHSAKSKGLENRFSRDQPKFSKQVPTTRSNNVAPTRTQERKVPGSLMNATKSSSAKVVPKVVKERELPKNMSRSQRCGQTSRHQQHHEEREPPVRDIPVMERSGTFLKDEPTFGDKLTNLDISQ
ncbi:hypothetical protein SFRURICE_007825 [Spodoptera frugiperda]|nr:hypothetical protein SFRURICE_007825 [Spodoptera frugiperda]